MIMACYWLWYPQSCLPEGFTNIPDGRRKFSNIIIVFTFLTTFLGFLQPVISFLFTKFESDFLKTGSECLLLAVAWHPHCGANGLDAQA